MQRVFYVILGHIYKFTLLKRFEQFNSKLKKSSCANNIVGNSYEY